MTEESAASGGFAGTDRARSCIVCGELRWEPTLQILSRCVNCGYVRAEDSLSRADIERIYGEDYFDGQEYFDYLGDQTAHDRNFARKWEMMCEISGPPESVFEIGCAYGLWLQFLTSRGVRCAGIDVSQGAIRHAVDQLNQKAVCGDFLELDVRREGYDTYVLWDTIEHLTSPEAYIERISQNLQGGGFLFLSTGDLGSVNAQRRGARWRMIHPPSHLHYFDRETISRLLQRHGFRVREIRALPIYRSLGGTLGSLNSLGQGWMSSAAGLAHRCIPNLVLDRLGAWTDLGDIMFVAASKL